MNDDEMRNALRKAMPAPDATLREDLWPRMLRRLDRKAPPRAWLLDWALLALLALWCLIFPGMIPGLIYHL